MLAILAAVFTLVEGQQFNNHRGRTCIVFIAYIIIVFRDNMSLSMLCNFRDYISMEQVSVSLHPACL